MKFFVGSNIKTMSELWSTVFVMLRRYGAFVFLALLTMGLSADVLAEKEGTPETDSVTFLEGDFSTAYRAVFAQFLSVIPNDDPSLSVDSAISVSNVCAAPDVLTSLVTTGGPKTGRVALYLYDRDGTLTMYVSNPASPGSGLNANGALGPGQTWTVRLAEVIAAARGIKERQIEFSGYGWVMSEFDCLAGTYSNTIFGLGFTQNFEMLPGMGQGGFIGGLMVPQP